MAFRFFSNPQLHFGPGTIHRLPGLVTSHGRSLLLITGARSLQKSDVLPRCLDALKKNSIQVHQASIATEPSPARIDEIVATYRDKNIDVIAAIGGGSVMDAGKAVSAMMTKKESIIEYLEGVGKKSHDGKKIFFIAVPTTSGTGSEATKNAVISQLGKNGFKKSLRHDNFVPDIAVVDPELTLGCPAKITAACGMDAVTQLLESLVSPQSSPMTDSLALGALEVLGNALITVTTVNPHDLHARTNISYAAYISGLTLANAGLGVVHGFASVIGGMFNIPHGVICGTLLAEATRHNIECLISMEPDGAVLKKYAKAFQGLHPAAATENHLEKSRQLIKLLTQWTDDLKIPKLGSYGLTRKDIQNIVSDTQQKNNPVQLSAKKLSEILEIRL
jgi:alcohol dehydrogenase class IV